LVSEPQQQEAELSVYLLPRIIERPSGGFNVLEPDFADPGIDAGILTVGFESRADAQAFIDNLVRSDPERMARSTPTLAATRASYPVHR
jgi:hypothetical protein